MQATPKVRLNVETTTRCAKREGVGDHYFAAKFPFKTLLERLLKVNLAIGFVFGIGRAIRRPMKHLHTELHHEREVIGDAKVRTAEQPKILHIVFEDYPNARGTEILIKHRSASAKLFIPELKHDNKLDCLSTFKVTS